jgi:hypothetical protein
MRPLLVAACTALAVLALRAAMPGTPGDVPAPRVEARAGGAVAPVPPPPVVTRDGVDEPPDRSERAVATALERHLAATGLADRISAADHAALRDALVAARRASLRARRRSRDGEWQGVQSRALVEADRVFRESLGTGIADFVADAGPPGRIEDVGRPPS